MPKKAEIFGPDIKNAENDKIIIEFEKLINQIKYQIDNAPSKNESMTNYYRLRQVTAALNTIKKYPKTIVKGEDLKDIKGIGKGTISRINEILQKGRLSEIKMKKEHKDYLDIIEELEKIIGIGRKTAYELVKVYDIKSIDELIKAYKEGKIVLNNQILLGLKYHNVYEQNIPRAEIDEIYEYLKSVGKSIDKDLILVICGSYRRLKPFSNDIDILIAHPKIITMEEFLKHESYLLKFIGKLKKDKFLLDDLTDKDFEIKYMGFCQYKKDKIYPVRRIDIRYVPYDSFYTALLYFTGSGEFNRKMRGLAISLGYMLNEYGLYKIKGNKKIRIKINSEKDVFDILGMEYLSPEKRN